MVTTYSDQYSDMYVEAPLTIHYASEVYGAPSYLPFTYTQVALGTIGDLVYLVKVPPVCEILVLESLFRTTAWAASTTIDIGYLAYKTPQGADVAADDNGLISGMIVTAVGKWYGGTQYSSTGTVTHNDPVVDIFSIRAQKPVTITAVFRGANPTAGDTLSGYIKVLTV